MKLIIAIAILFFSLPSATYSTEIHTTCHIPTAVNGGNTSLTCNFGVDVGLLQLDIQIVRQSNTNDVEKTDILMCLWDKETLDCIVHESFSFDYKMSDTLELKIPSAEHIPGGNYKCIVLGFENGNFEKCSFVKQEGTTASRRVQITSTDSISPVTSAAWTMKCFGAKLHYVIIVVLVCLSGFR